MDVTLIDFVYHKTSQVWTLAISWITPQKLFNEILRSRCVRLYSKQNENWWNWCTDTNRMCKDFCMYHVRLYLFLYLSLCLFWHALENKHFCIRSSVWSMTCILWFDSIGICNVRLCFCIYCLKTLLKFVFE